MARKQMPKIDAEKVLLPVDNNHSFYGEILALVVKPDGRLRATKPPTDKPDPFTGGCAAYVWRMVAFLVSPHSRHHCMPYCADMDIALPFERKREFTKRLDKVVDAIVDAVDPHDWHGVRRWGQAYGLIGKPVVRQGGTIVYR